MLRISHKVPETQSRVIAYKVEHNAKDHLALWVKYYYDGNQGDHASIGAITLTDGSSNGYWAYRGDPLFKGTHWAKILIANADAAPDWYVSDQIKFEMYTGGGPTFGEATVAFKKRWERLKKPSLCHLTWGRGCHLE